MPERHVDIEMLAREAIAQLAKSEGDEERILKGWEDRSPSMILAIHVARHVAEAIARKAPQSSRPVLAVVTELGGWRAGRAHVGSLNGSPAFGDAPDEPA